MEGLRDCGEMACTRNLCDGQFPEADKWILGLLLVVENELKHSTWIN